MNIIAQKMRRKQSLMEYSLKHGVSKASRKYNRARRPSTSDYLAMKERYSRWQLDQCIPSIVLTSIPRKSSS